MDEEKLGHNLNPEDLAWLMSIHEAVERIDRDRYGECVNCGEDIDERQLTSVPWAELCMRCHEEVETDRAYKRGMAAASEPESPRF